MKIVSLGARQADACDVERRRTIIAQHYRLCRARGAHESIRECQADWRQSGVRSGNYACAIQSDDLRIAHCIIRDDE